MTKTVTKLKPAGWRILVKKDQPTQEVDIGSENGKLEIVRPEEEERLAKHNQQTGTLIAVGPDAWKAFRKVNDSGKEVNGQPWANPGDRVWFSRNCGRVVVHPETEEEFLLMNDEDISLVLETVEIEDEDAE